MLTGKPGHGDPEHAAAEIAEKNGGKLPKSKEGKGFDKSRQNNEIHPNSCEHLEDGKTKCDYDKHRAFLYTVTDKNAPDSPGEAYQVRDSLRRAMYTSEFTF